MFLMNTIRRTFRPMTTTIFNRQDPKKLSTQTNDSSKTNSVNITNSINISLTNNVNSNLNITTLEQLEALASTLKPTTELNRKKSVLVITQDKCPGCEKVKPVYTFLQQYFPNSIYTINLTNYAKLNKKSPVEQLKKTFGHKIQHVPYVFLLDSKNKNLVEHSKVNETSIIRSISNHLDI